MLKILLVTCIVIPHIVADCPISYYPQNTEIGKVQAAINNQNGVLEYYHAAEWLTPGQAKIAVGLLGMEVKLAGALSFDVRADENVVDSKFKFVVEVNDVNFGWRTLTFSYLATKSDLFQIQKYVITDIKTLSGGKNNIYQLYKPISSYTKSPILTIRSFLSGTTISPSSLRQQPSLSSLPPSLSLSPSLTPSATSPLTTSTLASQILQLQQSLSVRILSTNQIGRFLNVKLQIKDQIKFGVVSFSVVIWSAQLISQKNFAVSGIAVLGDFRGFTGFADTMLFYGLNDVQVPRSAYYQIDITYQNLDSRTSFDFTSTHPYIPLSLSYISTQKKPSQLCSSCENSPYIYNDKYCIQKCPQGFSVTEIAGAKICDQCSIELVKVVDPDTGSCVCAKRHFLDSGVTGACKPCRYDCMTCAEAGKCLTCDNSNFQTKRVRNSAGGCQCPAVGFYDDSASENIVCQACSPKCVTCTGPRDFDCRTCAPDKVRDSQGFCVCKNGFVEDLLGKCSCPGPSMSLLNGTCIDNTKGCPPQKQETLINGLKTCICKPPQIQINTKCLLCGSNSIFNPSQLRCQCKKPTVLINNQCVQCKENQNQIYNEGLDMCVCIGGAFRNGQGKCVRCPNKMFLFNQQCQCVYNYYQVQPGVCAPCQNPNQGPKCRRTVN